METIVDQLEKWIGSINELLSKLWGLPYLTVVFVLCFAVGLALRYSRRFPNDAIPLVVVCVGAIFAPLLADPRADSLPLRVWVAKNIAVGIIIGLATWVLHRYALKPLARKVSWLGWLAPYDGDTQIIVNPNPPTKTETAPPPAQP